MEERWAGHIQDWAFHNTNQGVISRCNPPIIWFLCSSYKCKLILLLNFICHLSIIQISSGQDVCNCRISSNHHKGSGALCKERGRKGQIVGAWRTSSSGGCRDKIPQNLFHTFIPLSSMPKKNWNSLAKHTNHINQKYSAFGSSSLKTHLFITKCYLWWKALMKYFTISFLVHWFLWLCFQHFN